MYFRGSTELYCMIVRFQLVALMTIHIHHSMLSRCTLSFSTADGCSIFTTVCCAGVPLLQVSTMVIQLFCSYFPVLHAVAIHGLEGCRCGTPLLWKFIYFYLLIAFATSYGPRRDYWEAKIRNAILPFKGKEKIALNKVTFDCQKILMLSSNVHSVLLVGQDTCTLLLITLCCKDVFVDTVLALTGICINLMLI